ncbi:MAG: pyridoxal phosphate-dependent aminotransferase [Vampirovibrio sp.]|nr:pyridoxal phosphate-dependent aminotransferase [Vampirovibrio sp.]
MILSFQPGTLPAANGWLRSSRQVSPLSLSKSNLQTVRFSAQTVPSNDPLSLNDRYLSDEETVATYVTAFDEHADPKTDMLKVNGELTITPPKQFITPYKSKRSNLIVSGTKRLKDRIAETYQAQGLPIKGEQIVLTTEFRSLLGGLYRVLDGDIMLATPFWPYFKTLAKDHGKQVYEIPTSGQTGITLSTLKSTYEQAVKKPRILLIHNPSDINGLISDNSDVEAIADFCKKNNIVIFNIQSFFVYPDFHDHKDFASLYPEGTITINNTTKDALGLNKYGIGWAVVPNTSKGRTLMNRLKDLKTLKAPTAAEAGKNVEMLEYVDTMVRFHHLRTQFLYREFGKMGLAGPRPLFTPNMLISFKKYKKILEKIRVHNDKDLQKFLLKKIGIGTLPGSLFNLPEEDMFLRISTGNLDPGALNGWVDSWKTARYMNEKTHPELHSVVKKFRALTQKLDDVSTGASKTEGMGRSSV